MHIGPFHVHETVKICPLKNCRKTYHYTGLDVFLPPGSNFGYDVIAYVGEALWGKSRTPLQIQADLKQRNNLTISESEITLLAKKFVHYVVEAQRDKQAEIKKFLHRGGGFFMYFDAMHPGNGAAHLMCAIAEEVSEKVSMVLGSVKLPTESTETVFQSMPEIIKAYCKALWIIAYEQELNGYGYPFDRSELAYLQRMKKTYNSLKAYPLDSKELSELKFLLASILEDPDLCKHMDALEKKVQDFDYLRTIMKIAPIYGVKGLNDDGEECDMTAMEEQLKVFIESDELKNNSDKAYQKMIKQILKYWKMLFSKPIEVRLSSGETILTYPQRTSNCMERLFRENFNVQNTKELE